MAVGNSSVFWLRSVLAGRFRKAIGVRLYGTAGPRREATVEELEAVERRVRLARLTRGGRALWSDRFVRYPAMMPRG